MKLLLSIAMFSAMFLASFSQNNVCFQIEANPNSSDPALSAFTKYVNVFGLGVYAEASVPDEKVLHIAAVFAEWLDNNEDSVVDNNLVYNELISRNALMPVFSHEGSVGENTMFENYTGEGVGAVCYVDEIVPQRPLSNQFDATVEEILHTISSVGYANAYPDAFGEEENSNSLLCQAMDVARGGHFVNIPSSYPSSAWYHYDDNTCEYNCMATEYFYWGLTSMLGIQDFGNRCSEINNEWEACTAEQFQEMDVLLYQLFNDENYILPTVAPDGNYCPSSASGIKKHREDNLKIYPNPTQGQLNLEYNKTPDQKADLLDVHGKLCKSFNLDNNLTQVDVSDLPEGVYFLKMDAYVVRKILVMQ
jgi:hypothetical protein